MNERTRNTVRIASASLALVLTVSVVPVPPVQAQTADQAVERCALKAKEQLSRVEVKDFRESINTIVNDYYKCVREAQTQVAPPPSPTSPGSGQQGSNTTNEGGETVEELFREKAEGIGGPLLASFLSEINRLDGYRRDRLTKVDRCLQGPALTDDEREEIKKYISEWPRRQRQKLYNTITADEDIKSLQKTLRAYYVADHVNNWSRILLGFCMIDTGIKQINRLEKLFPNLRSSIPTAFGRLNKPLSEARVKLLAAKDLLLKAMETTNVSEAKNTIDQAYVQIRDAYRLIRIVTNYVKKGTRRSVCKLETVDNPAPEDAVPCLFKK